MRYSKSTPPSRIVVRAPNFIGDTVMAVPLFRGIRAAFPSAQLTAVATSGPSEFLRLPTFSDIFSEIWTLKDRSVASQWRMAAQIRRGNFDVAVSLPASTSSALLFCLARVTYRIGWAEPTATYFYHSSLDWKGRASGLHKSDLYTQLLSLLSTENTESSWGAAPNANSGNSSYFVVAPGASIALRQWPRLLEFLKLLRSMYPKIRVVLVGGSGENSWAKQVAGLSDPFIEDKIGKTSIHELVALCEGARAVVTMDSGTAHIAATVADAPTVVVFGPGDPAYVLPRGTQVKAVRRADLACSPCESPTCAAPYGYQVCLKELNPRSVLDALSGFVDP